MSAKTLTYDFTYLPCQSCHAKVNCDQCEAKIGNILMRIEGVSSVEVCMPKKNVRIYCDCTDADTIEDELEANGVFLD